MIDKKSSPSIHTKFYIKKISFEFKLLKPTLKQRLLSLDWTSGHSKFFLNPTGQNLYGQFVTTLTIYTG